MGDGAYVHRAARDLVVWRGCTLAARTATVDLRHVARALDGSRVHTPEAAGKHLLVHTTVGALHVHFGARGRLRPVERGDGAPEDRVLQLAAGGAGVHVVAPWRCEVLDAAGVARVRARLGPDPLRADADVADAWARLRGARGTVGEGLLDQAVVAGIGNAARAEALHRAGVHPLRRAASLSRAEFAILWSALQAVQSERLAAEPSVFADEARDGGALVANAVYRRKRCAVCGRPVQRVTIAGRTAYLCPRCQPADPTRVVRRPGRQRRTTGTVPERGAPGG